MNQLKLFKALSQHPVGPPAIELPRGIDWHERLKTVLPDALTEAYQEGDMFKFKCLLVIYAHDWRHCGLTIDDANEFWRIVDKVRAHLTRVSRAPDETPPPTQHNPITGRLMKIWTGA